MADFLVLDPTGANLAVEIDTSGASMTYDRSGISEQDADDGSRLVSVSYGVRRVGSFKSKWMTTEEFEAVKTASKMGLEPIDVTGHFIRTTTPNTAPQTMSALVDVSQADFFDNGNADFLHIAQINVREVLG